MHNPAPALRATLLTLLVAALAAAYGPLLIEFASATWLRPHYQHFPFVLLASGLLFVNQLVTPTSRRPPTLGWAIGGALAAWLLLAVGYQIPSPLFAAASLVLLLGAGGVMMARQAGASFPTGPWALLWLVLPPPLGLDYRLMEVLQHSSSWLASNALDVLRVEHLMEGNSLVIGDRTFFVDEACSGIVSAVSIVSCAAMYAVWRRRGLAHGLLLMGASAGWAMLMNVVRIVSIALAHTLAGLDWAEGPAHTGVGLAAFGFSLVTLVATDWLLKALLAEVGPRWQMLTAEPIRFGQWLVDAWDSAIASREARTTVASRPADWRRMTAGSIGLTGALVASLAFGGLGATQLLRSTVFDELEAAFPEVERFAEELEASGMPAEVEGLKLVKTEGQTRGETSLFGQRSVIFYYEGPNAEQYLVSCDFPFVGGWHDLSVCYRGIGWQLDATTAESREHGAGEAFDAVQFDLTKPDGMAALVSMCACYREGSPVEAPLNDTLSNRLLTALSRRDAASDTRRSFQVQVLVERSGRVSQTDRDASWRLLEVARQRFVEAILKVGGAPAEARDAS